MKSGAVDWRTAQSLTLSTWHNENIDIHHIFPKGWCQNTASPKIPPSVFDSIINKTPISAKTNKIIGANAPSRYLPRLQKENNELNHALETHWLDPELLDTDKFAECFVQRGEAMLDLIGRAMGKPITGGQETFWAALVSAGVAKSLEVVTPSEVELEMDDADDEIEFDELGEVGFAEEQLVADN